MILAVVGGKGGVGKSTTAISLAVEAHAKGIKTLLVDLDTQRTCLVWAAVAAEQKQNVPPTVAMGANVQKQLPEVAAPYQLVILDGSPRVDAVTRSALMASDFALLPSNGTPQDVWSLADTIKLVGDAQAMRPALKAALLITRTRAGTTLARETRGILEEAGLPVLRASLGLRDAFSDAIAAGTGPTVHQPRSEAAEEVRRLLREVLKMAGGK